MGNETSYRIGAYLIWTGGLRFYAPCGFTPHHQHNNASSTVCIHPSHSRGYPWKDMAMLALTGGIRRTEDVTDSVPVPGALDKMIIKFYPQHFSRHQYKKAISTPATSSSATSTPVTSSPGIQAGQPWRHMAMVLSGVMKRTEKATDRSVLVPEVSSLLGAGFYPAPRTSTSPTRRPAMQLKQ